ncbi:MAG TPA: hypothetical protein VFY45_24140 [Baekduia sp.]|nr:hypothetical protein [Baekduia sp.]
MRAGTSPSERILGFGRGRLAVTALLLQPPQQHEAACTAPITRTALKNRTASASDNDA